MMMTSSAADDRQLMNGDEDPYKSEGHIKLRIENFAEFSQEELYSKRLSEPVHILGVPWKILAIVRPHGHGQKCLGYFLQCNNDTDPFWSFSTTAQLKVLAQREDCADHVRDIEHTFHAKENDWGYAQFMSFEDLMDPDSGWYDEQADSIVFEVDFAAALPKEIGEYVLVAENELKLDRVPLCFSVQIGHREWEVNFNYDDQANKSGAKSLVISCKDVAKGWVDKVALGLFGFHRNHPKSELYSPFPEKAVHSHWFTSEENTLTVKVPGGRTFNNLLFTARVYKERSQFPDFTKPTAMLGRFSADVKLRLGEQLFHVNRQLLSSLSPFFDRMFNGLYPAATREEVELSLLTHSPELFQDFLLVLCINEILPNSMNVTSLFKLADFYDVENVRQKCDQHLLLAREMPIEKRVLLARDHGSSAEMQAQIMDSANFEQLKAINLLLLQNRSI